MVQPPAGAVPAYLSYLTAPAIEPSPRWVRVQFGGQFIADSKRALLLRQYGPGRLPTYYFPQDDVRMDFLEAQAAEPPDDLMTYWTVRVGERVAARAAWAPRDPAPAVAALAGHLTFTWAAMDAWYEEEQQVFVHARDPYKRVDVLESSRHVRVVVGNTLVAETRRPSLLFETGLPVRYYIPAADVRADLLEPSSLTTRCPYKGIASYWSVKVGDRRLTDLVWSYPDPILECPRIKGLLCFFNERVDLYVDGELQERPHTPWSRTSADRAGEATT
jgi:uncharacterized protein (DUF427 family)